MPKIDIRRQCYAMASKDGDNAEVTMYGDVVESTPTDWWTGKKLDGNYIALDEFLADLDQLRKCKAVTIRLNSYGGDAVVGMTIHNRLRELARDGVRLTCIVDGVAMSAASVIMAACDTVQVNPTGLVMIHRAWAFLWGGYNAADARQQAEALDSYDRAMAAAYHRKTGIEESELLQMMTEETYLTGRDAVDRGFADTLIEDAEDLKLAASANGDTLFVRGQAIHLVPGMFAPDFIPTAAPEEAAASSTVNPVEASAHAVETHINQPENAGNEGGKNPMTLEELRAQQPELVQQIEASAAQAERARLQGIDDVAALFSADLVAEAKYGQTACSAETLALRAAKAAQKAGTSFLSNLADDAKASGAEDVTPAAVPDETAPTNESIEAAGEAMAKKLRESE